MKLPAHSKKRTIGIWIRWIILPLLMGGATVALISGTEKKEWEITLNATFDNLSENLVVVDAQQYSVHLSVTATAAAMKAMGSNEATCRLDLSGLGEGRHTIPVKPTDIGLPKGISLSSLLTPALTIRLETVSHKRVEVIAELEGAPAPGFAVASVHLKPDRVTLTGTTTQLAGIDTVKSKPINLQGASESFKKEAPLNLPDAIMVDPPSRIVVAEVEIRERMVTRVLKNIPISAKGSTAGHRINPDEIELTVSGPETIVRTIESDPAFSVTIDLTGLAPGTHSLKAAIKLPVRVALVRAVPETFTVTISK